MSIRYNNYLKEVSTDYSMLVPGALFPPNGDVARHIKYKFENRLFSGEYADNKRLQITATDSTNTPRIYDLEYKRLSTNKFKLYTNKIDSVVFGVGDVDVKADTEENTNLLVKLVERTKWIASIRDGFRRLEVNGNSILRTYMNGVDVLEPLHGFKIINEHDKKEVITKVLFEVMYDNKITPSIEQHIRVELHCNGHVAERVYKAYPFGNGQYKLGEPVNYNYRGRLISADGNFYSFDIPEVSMVEWLSIDTESDNTGVYGVSPYWDFKDLIFKLEELLSIESYVIETNAKPLLAVSSKLIVPDEQTGGYKLKKIEGAESNILPLGKDDMTPEFIQNANTQLEHSALLRKDMDEQSYELMEMNKAFMRGEYGGNVSNETLNDIMKGCIDRAERHWWSIYWNVKNSLYILARFNGLNIPYESIEIVANIGVNENKKQLSEISGALIDKKILSRQTVRSRFYGMSKEQSEAEDAQIAKEAGINEMVRRVEEVGDKLGGGSSDGGTNT